MSDRHDLERGEFFVYPNCAGEVGEVDGGLEGGVDRVHVDGSS